MANNCCRGKFTIYESTDMTIFALCLEGKNLSFRPFSNHFRSFVMSVCE